MSQLFDETVMPRLIGDGPMEVGPLVITLSDLHDALSTCAKDLPWLQERRNEAGNDYEEQLSLTLTYAQFLVEGWREALDRQSEEWRDSEDGQAAWEIFAEWEAYLEELRDLEADEEAFEGSERLILPHYVPNIPSMLPVDLES